MGMQDKVHENVSETKENIAALTIFGIIIIVAVGLFTNWYGLASPSSDEPLQKVTVPYENDPIRGNASAKVIIFVFSDFECPFCKKGEDTVMSVLNKYNGEVSLIFKHFPLTQIHPNAYNSALASECANEQGKFWEYHDYLFAHNNALTLVDLKAYAKELNLNTDQFDNCLDSKKYSFNVQRDMDIGKSVGVSATPAFFINGIPLIGAQPEAEFTKIIDVELKK